ncbi:MAG: Ca2+-dependent phosphoinositide-specific phospholipase C [Oscillospiraceae bacterium]|nr:Ca2+-dependent phosphoinositide-specific phospholipase C [Oscillospiraceae bacterium]
MKKAKKWWKIPLISFGVLFALVFVFAIAVAWQGMAGMGKWREWQKSHLAALESEFVVIDNAQSLEKEKLRTGIDIEQAIAEGVRLNQLRGIFTHNSYKQGLTPMSRVLYNILTLLGVTEKDSYTYSFPPITEQLNSGVMGLELDLYQNKAGEFMFFHSPVIDMESTGINAQLALREVSLWSRANPSHLPAILLIEAKGTTVAPFGLYGMSGERVEDFDNLVREELGENVLTPAELLRDYSTFAGMGKEKDWPLLEETLGKVLVFLHPGHATQDFLALDETLRTQAMIPAFSHGNRDHEQAAMVLVNDPVNYGEDSRQIVNERGLLVRSRLDVWPNHLPQRYEAGLNSDAQWLSTDYPIGLYEDYSAVFPNGFTADIRP